MITTNILIVGAHRCGFVVFRLRVITTGEVDDSCQTTAEVATGIGTASSGRPPREAPRTESSQTSDGPTGAGTSLREGVSQTGARTSAGPRCGADTQRRHPAIGGGVPQQTVPSHRSAETSPSASANRKTARSRRY